MPTTYALIDASGNIVRKEEFDGEAPALAAAKGLRWVPAVPPAYDPATQRAPRAVLPVQGGAVSYTVDAIPIEELRAAKLAKLAAIRYARETAGISVAGAQIRTDRESQYTLAGALLAIQQGLVPGPIDWKAASGWVQVSSAQLAAIAQAVASHVQACFSRERALAEQLAAAADIAAVNAIDLETGWPT